MARAGLDAAAVVRAARDLADADGLQELTLARLAQRLGVRSPSLYAHVGGLDDLRARIGVAALADLHDVLAAAAAGRSGREALAEVADAYRAFARAHPGAYAAVQRAPRSGEDARADAAARVIDIFLAVLRGYGLAGDDALHATRILRAALHGFVTLEAGDGFGLPLGTDETFARLIDALDASLLASARR